jgi:hypothetical protein
MDWIYSLCSCPWTSCFPSVCCAQYFLNILHILEILYLFLVACQTLSINYGSLLIIHLILVGNSIAHISSCCHYLLYLLFLHHDWVHGLLLISLNHFFLHFSTSCQGFPPSPMHAGKFSCLIPWSSHRFYIIKS